MYRDFFKCNPTNTGHHKYPKFETLSYDDGCHFREVGNIVKLKKKYPDIYVLFYTRHNGMNKIIGYFKVGKTFSNGNKGFKSSETVLLPKNQCIEIPYKSRGVPVSWGNSSIKPNIDKILPKVISDKKKDISDSYKSSTDKIMKILTSSKGQDKMISICEKCNDRRDCPWGKYPIEKKIKRLKELYEETDGCRDSTGEIITTKIN